MMISNRECSKRQKLSPFSSWSLILFLSIPLAVLAWLPSSSSPSIGYRIVLKPLFLSIEDNGNYGQEEEPSERPLEDFTGKTIFQRTFYRLSPDSQVQLPNAMMIEERLRFIPDMENPGYILPIGPRTLILREGSEGE